MSADKRERIIEAATQSFSEYGFKGTTMDRVARIAKVGKGTVYVFFKNKDMDPAKSVSQFSLALVYGF